MSEKKISINIETQDDEPVFVAAAKLNGELRIKFIHNFEEAVAYAPDMITINKDMKLTIEYKSLYPDDYDFMEGK